MDVSEELSFTGTSASAYPCISYGIVAFFAEMDPISSFTAALG